MDGDRLERAESDCGHTRMAFTCQSKYISILTIYPKISQDSFSKESLETLELLSQIPWRRNTHVHNTPLKHPKLQVETMMHSPRWHQSYIVHDIYTFINFSQSV